MLEVEDVGAEKGRNECEAIVKMYYRQRGVSFHCLNHSCREAVGETISGWHSCEVSKSPGTYLILRILVKDSTVIVRLYKVLSDPRSQIDVLRFTARTCSSLGESYCYRNMVQLHIWLASLSQSGGMHMAPGPLHLFS